MSSARRGSEVWNARTRGEQCEREHVRVADNLGCLKQTIGHSDGVLSGTGDRQRDDQTCPDVAVGIVAT